MSREELSRIRTVYERRQAPAIAGRYARHHPGEAYMLRRRQDQTRALLLRHCPRGLADLRVLDVGCGRGERVAEMTQWGADPRNLTGIDLLEPFVLQARASFPGCTWLVGSGDALPFANDCFDLVGQAMAVSSILDQHMRERVAAEMWRVTRPGGLILWYDLRYANPWNPDLRPVARDELARLFPLPPVECLSATLLPPVSRRLARLSPALCRALEHLPWLRSHYLTLFRKAPE